MASSYKFVVSFQSLDYSLQSNAQKHEFLKYPLTGYCAITNHKQDLQPQETNFHRSQNKFVLFQKVSE